MKMSQMNRKSLILIIWTVFAGFLFICFFILWISSCNTTLISR